MKIPDEFHGPIAIDSLETANQALHQLGWLESQQAALEAKCQQAIEKLKEEFARGCPRIRTGDDETECTIPERIAIVRQQLTEWTEENIKQYLGDRKSVTLSHGLLGLRQVPLVAEADVGEDEEPYKPKAIIEWIQQSDLKPAQKRKLLKTTIALHLVGAKEAYVQKKISLQELVNVGITIREEHDIPVVAPAEVTVTSETADV